MSGKSISAKLKRAFTYKDNPRRRNEEEIQAVRKEIVTWILMFGLEGKVDEPPTKHKAMTKMDSIIKPYVKAINDIRKMVGEEHEHYADFEKWIDTWDDETIDEHPEHRQQDKPPEGTTTPADEALEPSPAMTEARSLSEEFHTPQSDRRPSTALPFPSPRQEYSSEKKKPPLKPMIDNYVQTVEDPEKKLKILRLWVSYSKKLKQNKDVTENLTKLRDALLNKRAEKKTKEQTEKLNMAVESINENITSINMTRKPNKHDETLPQELEKEQPAHIQKKAHEKKVKQMVNELDKMDDDIKKKKQRKQLAEEHKQLAQEQKRVELDKKETQWNIKHLLLNPSQWEAEEIAGVLDDYMKNPDEDLARRARVINDLMSQLHAKPQKISDSEKKAGRVLGSFHHSSQIDQFKKVHGKIKMSTSNEKIPSTSNALKHFHSSRWNFH